MQQLTHVAGLPVGTPPSRQIAALSRRAKAAIVVQFILKEGADVPLSSLPEDLQVQLTHLLGEMRYIDRATMNAVITEFAEELIRLAFPFQETSQARFRHLMARSVTRLPPAFAKRPACARSVIPGLASRPCKRID